MQRPIIGEGVSHGVTPNSGRCKPAAGSTDFAMMTADLPDVSRIRSIVPATAGYFAWGCFRYFFAGAAATLRDSETPCLKAHMPARPSLQQSGAPDAIRTCDLCLRRIIKLGMQGSVDFAATVRDVGLAAV